MKYLPVVLITAVLMSGCGGGGSSSPGPVSMMPDEPPVSMMPDEPPVSMMPDEPPVSMMPDEPAPMPTPDTALMTIGTATALANPAPGFHPYSYDDWGFWAENDQGETIFKGTLNTPDVPVQDLDNTTERNA